MRLARPGSRPIRGRGTGLYRGIRSGSLQVVDDNTLDGQSGIVSVKGAATY